MRGATAAVVGMALGMVLAGCIESAKKPGAAAKPAAGSLAIRVNCGAAAEYKDAAGNVWLPDQEYKEGLKWGAVGGTAVSRTLKTIEGTKAPQVYLTERYSMSAYRFDVPNGKYTVRLHLAETFEQIQQAGLRLFTVKVQGDPRLKDFDPFREAGGFAKPVVKEFRGIEVKDGRLMIEFVANVQNPEINGIEIIAE